MRYAFLVLVLTVVGSAARAQGMGAGAPVQWTFSLGQDSGRQVLNAAATVADGWYVYSQFLGDGGPVPTSIDLGESEGLTLRGPSVEYGERIVGHDDMFDMEIVSYKDSLRISQPLELAAGTERVVGVLEYMTCNGKVCLPPTEVEIAVNVPRG